MQEDHVPGRDRLDGSEHLVDRQAVGGLIKVGVGLGRYPRSGKNARMVWPGRIAEPHRGLGEILVQKIGGHPQASRATGCVHPATRPE